LNLENSAYCGSYESIQATKPCGPERDSGEMPAEDIGRLKRDKYAGEGTPVAMTPHGDNETSSI